MEDELYLENIDEFVTDQNRIVTYKWLSYTLGVHVNQAKQMLFDYVERKRKENSGAQLHVTYLLAGDLLQNGHLCHRVAVVREDQLEAMKSKLASICSLHIYSIQRALLKDSGPLYSTDYDITKANLSCCARFSAIHCAAAVPRPPLAAPADQAPARAVPQPPGASGTATGTAATATTVNGHAACSAKQQPKGIMGMFAMKVAPRGQESSKDRAEGKEPAAVPTGSRAPGKSSSISNFFGKAALNKLRGSSVPEQPKEEEKEEASALAAAIEPAPVPAPVPGCTRAVPRPEEETEAGRSQHQDSKSGRKLKRDQEEEEDPELKKRKRRKRIRELQSDSSGEEGAQQPPAAEAEEAPTAELQPVGMERCPQGAAAGRRRRRRQRVLKSKMFIDEEEGCMVTEKVYESESCSDSQEEPCSPVPAVPARAPALPPRGQPREQRRSQKRGAAAGTRATKQPSIVGFFHRK